MYAYDTIGNITSFRRAFPAAGEGTGFFKVGGLMDSAVYDARADFNPFAAMHRTGTAINGDGVSYFVTGRVGPNAAPVASGMRLQGSFYPGVYASSSLYEGPQGINPLTGRDGVTAFARGVVNSGSGNGGYSGPYGEEVITYTYGENGAGPHAVTSRDISDTTSDDAFEYDENGNMTVRTQDGVTYCQTFDAENRLVLVETLSGGTCDSKVVATEVRYVYDGGGARIKKIVDDSTTTLYVAGMEIETQAGVSGSKKTVYYPAGAFRVIDTLNGADENDLYYRHSDHLGSTSVLSDWQGIKVADSDVVYAPFGEVRDGPESDLTDFGYTGQRRDDNTGGLMYYGARYYLPGVMRFISADTIVPNPANPQALNRYSYVYNRPISFVDPSGHAGGPNCKTIEGEYVCNNPSPSPSPPPSPAPSPTPTPPAPPPSPELPGDEPPAGDVTELVTLLQEEFGVIVTGYEDFEPGDQLTMVNNIYQAVLAMATSVADVLNSAPGESGNFTPGHAFKAEFGPTQFTIKTDGESINCGEFACHAENRDAKGVFNIDIYGSRLLEFGSDKGVNLAAHELAHTLTIQSQEKWDWFTDMKYPNPDYRNGENAYELDSLSYWSSYSSVHAQSNSEWYEFSADLIADWALGNGGSKQHDLAVCALTNVGC